MLLFDIGANRGDAVVAGLNKGYQVIAIEAAPLIFKELVKNFIYTENVIPLKFAVSDSDDQTIEFYECVEDGLSTLNKEWLTSDTMPYNGKEYRTIAVNTITIDTLVKLYGMPELIKIDVEGAEDVVFAGMTKKYGTITFEWTLETIKNHEKQLNYLYSLGYTEYAPQYIVNHLEEPVEWFKLKKNNKDQLVKWQEKTKDEWTLSGWQVANLRPTADVGMCWIR